VAARKYRIKFCETIQPFKDVTFSRLSLRKNNNLTESKYYMKKI